MVGRVNVVVAVIAKTVDLADFGFGQRYEYILVPAPEPSSRA